MKDRSLYKPNLVMSHSVNPADQPDILLRTRGLGFRLVNTVFSRPLRREDLTATRLCDALNKNAYFRVKDGVALKAVWNPKRRGGSVFTLQILFLQSAQVVSLETHPPDRSSRAFSWGRIFSAIRGVSVAGHSRPADATWRCLTSYDPPTQDAFV